MTEPTRSPHDRAVKKAILFADRALENLGCIDEQSTVDREKVRQHLRETLAALSQPQLRDAPEGEWVLVPKEPTSEMVNAWETAYRDAPEGSGVALAWDAAYSAMLKAAPPLPDPAIRKTEEEGG